jgi:hypothetical protein
MICRELLLIQEADRLLLRDDPALSVARNNAKLRHIRFHARVDLDQLP